jgi:hypothetical protein
MRDRASGVYDALRRIYSQVMAGKAGTPTETAEEIKEKD